ncbi:hypothetical protein C8R45DRAFT_636593 [Mycena sanguinolenta]|nr:hypothetical protein C8R45DRAFT_636593 [Mycena sanguinolenta]
MSSAPVLRARIDELSLAIEHQKQILRDLETRRSDARRNLNAILDPMARLPVEISSEILVRCLPDSPRAHPGIAPLLFLGICHRWTDIALTTPSLWTSLHWRSIADAVNLDMWLQRARGLPLSIRLHGDLRPDAVAVMKEHAPHLRVLTLETQHLKQMVGPSFPSLVTLNVINTPPVTATPVREFMIHLECVGILRAAPALAECDFTSASARWLWISDQSTSFTHPFLQRMRLSGPHCATFLLKYLTLPALETLYVSSLDGIRRTDLISFFTRSSPPLQSLHLGVHRNNHDLTEYLRLVPSVTNLGLEFTSGIVDPMLLLKDSLFGTNLEILPNLRNLSVESSRVFSQDINYDPLLDVLSARRHELQSFRFLSPNPKPPSDVRAALRQLAGDSGMHIHFGTHDGEVNAGGH